jgi:hypothetical protein
MDGAQGVERNRAAQAVSAKVHTGARRHVSFGEPEKRCDEPQNGSSRDSGWTNGYGIGLYWVRGAAEVVRV